MDYEIRVAGIEDKDTLLHFAERNYPEGATQRDPDRWDYVYGTGQYELWFAHDSSGAVLGHIATVEAGCAAGQRAVDLVWLCNIMVRPEARGQRVATNLVRAIEERHSNVGIAGANDASVGLSLSLGYHRPPDVPRYVRILNPSYYVSRAVGKFSLRESARDLAIAARFARPRRMPEAKGQHDFEIDPVHRFGEEVGTLMDRVQSHFSFMGDRSADELNSRFLQHPTIRATVLLASKSEDNLGYIVLAAVSRDKERVGFLLDWLFEPAAPEVGRRLLVQACNILKAAGAHRIEAWFQPRWMQELLVEAGFRQWPGGVQWTVSPAVGALIGDDQGSFHLSRADSNLHEECLLSGYAEAANYHIVDLTPLVQ